MTNRVANATFLVGFLSVFYSTKKCNKFSLILYSIFPSFCSVDVNFPHFQYSQTRPFARRYDHRLDLEDKPQFLRCAVTVDIVG